MTGFIADSQVSPLQRVTRVFDGIDANIQSLSNCASVALEEAALTSVILSSQGHSSFGNNVSVLFPVEMVGSDNRW